MADAISLTLMALSLAALYFLLRGGFKGPQLPPKLAPAERSYVPKLPATAPVLHWSDNGRYQVEVVAESRYQDLIRQLAGAHGDQGAEVRLTAVLVPDDLNPYEERAVVVFINGQLVGYLAPKDALALRQRLAMKDIAGQPTSCDAVIRGGGLWEGKRLNYGLWLDIEPSS